MSHNVNLEGVNISDISALRQAIDELCKEGARISLLESTTMRGYRNTYLSSGGMGNEKCDYVIRLEDSQYDVGLNWDADHEKLIARGETMLTPRDGGAAGTDHGAKTITGQACALNGPGAAIGRLVQRYNLIVAENEAARNGYTCTRDMDKKTGQMQLVVEGV